MEVERYACGCQPMGLVFCHLHSPEPADFEYWMTHAVWPRQSGKTALLDRLERGDQRHQDPKEQAGGQ